MYKQAGHRKIQESLQGFPKSCHTHQQRHSGRDSVNVRPHGGLGESVVAFALAGDLSSPSVISLNIEIAFAADGDKIRLPIAEVLLCAAASNLA